MSDATPERWLPVTGYEGFYEVSDLGRVRSLPRTIVSGSRHPGRILRPGRTSSGRRNVVLCDGPRKKTCYVHTLVAEAFLGPRPHGMQLRRRDSDLDNNALENLCYRPPRWLENPVPPDRVARNIVFAQYRNGAGHRGHVWELTGEQFDRLTCGECQYCGCPPSTIRRTGSGGRFVYNGIDRVDNALGYIMGNVVPCCSVCNHAKKDMSYGEFMAWIARLTEYHWFHPDVMPSRLLREVKESA